jgi:coenzyme PQQ synthesis protein D (PqqD)
MTVDGGHISTDAWTYSVKRANLQPSALAREGPGDGTVRTEEDAVNRFKIRTPLTIHETVDGEVVMVNLETGSYYSLVGSGARIWASVERGAAVAEIAADLRASFDGAGDGVEEKVRSLLDELTREGLIVPMDGASEACAALLVPMAAERQPFEPPVLQKFTDMQELILLDPVHEVEEEKGWPHAKAQP